MHPEVNTWFNILMPLMIVGLIWSGFTIVRRVQQRRAAWESGLTAQARVVRAWVTTQMVNNVLRRTQWHEYDFTTADGTAVRFKEPAGPPSRGAGDEVLVYYTEDEPDKATASAPEPGKDTARMAVTLLILGAGVVVLSYTWATMPRL